MFSKDNIDFWKNRWTQNFLLLLFGHRIISARTPRMTPGDSFHTDPGSFNNPPFVNGFDRVLRAGGCVAAMRAQHRRQGRLVNANRQYE